MNHYRLLPRLVTSCLLTFLGVSNSQAATTTATTLNVFAPGVISGPANDAAATFMPDGRTVFFFRSNGVDYDIMTSRFDGKRWLPSRVAPFSGRWRDLEPVVSPDGRFLVFASNRPVDGSNKPLDGHWNDKLYAERGGNLWRVDRRGNSWSRPERLPTIVNRFDSTFSPALALDGTLYFMAATGAHGRFRLYRTPFARGQYGTPEPLPFSTGQWSDMDAAVAPNQSFIVFASTRPPTPADKAEVFISFRHGKLWSRPQPVGAAINMLAPIIELRLGADGHTLYLTSRHVIPPAGYPKSVAESTAGLHQMDRWNNGSANIWKADLAPLLPTLRARATWPAPSQPIPLTND
ncbi:TolB family protein [Rhodanobacter aciditrophus]|uniref:TolB family protein n=1 Tax=Rhodanobacter aciditrophus TaxID=1623218 RepID=UPI003CF43EB8